MFFLLLQSKDNIHSISIPPTVCTVFVFVFFSNRDASIFKMEIQLHPSETLKLIVIDYFGENLTNKKESSLMRILLFNIYIDRDPVFFVLSNSV